MGRGGEFLPAGGRVRRDRERQPRDEVGGEDRQAARPDRQREADQRAAGEEIPPARRGVPEQARHQKHRPDEETGEGDVLVVVEGVAVKARQQHQDERSEERRMGIFEQPAVADHSQNRREPQQGGQEVADLVSRRRVEPVDQRGAGLEQRTVILQVEERSGPRVAEAGAEIFDHELAVARVDGLVPGDAVVAEGQEDDGEAQHQGADGPRAEPALGAPRAIGIPGGRGAARRKRLAFLKLAPAPGSLRHCRVVKEPKNSPPASSPG